MNACHAECGVRVMPNVRACHAVPPCVSCRTGVRVVPSARACHAEPHADHSQVRAPCRSTKVQHRSSTLSPNPAPAAHATPDHQPGHGYVWSMGRPQDVAGGVLKGFVGMAKGRHGAEPEAAGSLVTPQARIHQGLRKARCSLRRWLLLQYILDGN